MVTELDRDAPAGLARSTTLCARPHATPADHGNLGRGMRRRAGTHKPRGDWPARSARHPHSGRPWLCRVSARTWLGRGTGSPSWSKTNESSGSRLKKGHFGSHRHLFPGTRWQDAAHPAAREGQGLTRHARHPGQSLHPALRPRERAASRRSECVRPLRLQSLSLARAANLRPGQGGSSSGKKSRSLLSSPACLERSIKGRWNHEIHSKKARVHERQGGPARCRLSVQPAIPERVRLRERWQLPASERGALRIELGCQPQDKLTL